MNQVAEVVHAFLGLGLTAFGGPVAHLAHFRREFVERRGWLDEPNYAELVAFCQFLPGPTSSQVGFLIGWQRAGVAGALVAWCAFTLPSAILLTVAALAFGAVDGSGAWLMGMQAAVLAVVAQAVCTMARSLCPDAPRATIATAVAVICLMATAAWVPVAALVPAGLAGILVCRNPAGGADSSGLLSPSRRTTITCLLLLLVLIAAAVLAATMLSGIWAELFVICFKAGGLVFGGGHVVLPLLRDPLVEGGLISDQAFLAGYGAAQAVPGPLFTVAAWVGALVGGVAGAALALVAIFAPGLLLALGTLRFYHGALAAPWARRAVAGLNAGVVGLLGAALWHPLGSEAVHGPASVALALSAFVALEAWRIPAWAVVVGCCALTALGGWLL